MKLELTFSVISLILSRRRLWHSQELEALGPLTRLCLCQQHTQASSSLHRKSKPLNKQENVEHRWIPFPSLHSDDLIYVAFTEDLCPAWDYLRCSVCVSSTITAPGVRKYYFEHHRYQVAHVDSNWPLLLTGLQHRFLTCSMIL